MSEKREPVSERGVTGVTVTMEPGERDYLTEIKLAIAQALNTTPGELPPLEESIDRDEIEALFEEDHGVRLRPHRLSFEYADLDVTVYSDQSIHLAPRT